MDLNRSKNMIYGRIITKGLLWLLFLCVILILHSTQNFVQKESFSISKTILVDPFDKIMFRKNVTGLFEVNLPGMIEGQCIQVNLQVSKGDVEIKCMDRSNREVHVSEKEGFTGARFVIPYAADYSLLLDARNADFTFTVTVLDDSIN